MDVYISRRNMLPYDLRDVRSNSDVEEGRFPDYLRRLLDFRQMDFEAAFDQLLTLISAEPQRM